MPTEDNLLSPHVSLLTHSIRAWAITSSEQSTFHHRLVEKRSLARSADYNHSWKIKTSSVCNRLFETLTSLPTKAVPLCQQCESLGWQSSPINCFDEEKKWRLMVDLVDPSTWLQFPCTVSCPRKSYHYLGYLSPCDLKTVTYCQCKSDIPLLKKMWFYY